MPVLAGLSVEELLHAHREELPSGSSLLDAMVKSIEQDTKHTKETRGACASLPMRLAQVSYGYHGVSLTARMQGGLHVGQSQLEAPLQHRDAWTLLPIRKPLLTKRSRRCKLLLAEKPCRGLVVKPQINPCANPPFQKNSVAVSFIPRCLPWSYREHEGVHELILVVVNVLESDLELWVEPGAFNTPAGPEHWMGILSFSDAVCPLPRTSGPTECRGPHPKLQHQDF